MANKLPAEIIELMGQLRLLNAIASRMADDANDAWCEEGIGWSEHELEDAVSNDEPWGILHRNGTFMPIEGADGLMASMEFICGNIDDLGLSYRKYIKHLPANAFRMTRPQFIMVAKIAQKRRKQRQQKLLAAFIALQSSPKENEEYRRGIEELIRERSGQ